MSALLRCQYNSRAFKLFLRELVAYLTYHAMTSVLINQPIYALFTFGDLKRECCGNLRLPTFLPIFSHQPKTCCLQSVPNLLSIRIWLVMLMHFPIFSNSLSLDRIPNRLLKEDSPKDSKNFIKILEEFSKDEKARAFILTSVRPFEQNGCPAFLLRSLFASGGNC